MSRMRFHLLVAKPKKPMAGSALIIVLCFVVLLTILVTAFLSQSMVSRQIFNARAGQTQVDVLAGSAVEFMKADLRQEISAGSTIYSAPNTAGVSVPIYVPTSSATLTPARTGFTLGATPGSDPLDNVVKVSKSGRSFFSGAGYNPAFPSPNLASAVSTAAPALSGRYIDSASTGWTADGWNMPRLLDTSRYGGAAATAPLPDWIFVTSDTASGAGRKVITQPDASVVGRYAYVVYDEGGALDINAAGYPSAIVAADAREPGRKGPLALADLTQIPGITSALQDALVARRNQGSGATGVFSSSAYPSAGASDYSKYAFNSSLNKGGLLTYPGDQKFLSRQELIAFSTDYPAKLPPQSLPYLTTFTRTLNAPTWTPINPAGGSFDYASKAENAAGSWPFNVDSATTRWPVDVTITRPRLDEDVAPTAATVATETIFFRKGDPVIQHRFPLSKIALLSNPAARTIGSAGTAGSVAWAVNYYFGLQWVTTDATLAEPHWEYVHATNGATLASATDIRSIPEVAALQTQMREPDFFEMLRQGVLRGSAQDIMVLDMGASIIDQFDEDDEPTAITNGPGGSSRQAFGKENLPYFSQMLLWPYRPKSDPDRLTVEAYLIPVLWNPHRNAASPSTKITDFQITLNPSAASTPKVTISAVPGGSPVDTTGLQIPASLAFSTVTASYQEPTYLSGGVGVPTGGSGITELPRNRSGFYLGSVAVMDSIIATSLVPPVGGVFRHMNKATVGGVASITVQYMTPGGTWRTYENIGLSTGTAGATSLFTMDNAGAGASTNASPSFSDVQGKNAYDFFGALGSGPVDPRVSAGNVQGGSGGLAHTTLFPAGVNAAAKGETIRPFATTSPGALGTSTIAAQFGIFPQSNSSTIAGSSGVLYLGQWSENNTQTNAYYFDYATIATGITGDRVQRPGDGAYGAYPMATGQIQDRPIILNRPFRSVAEMGYAFRGVEWRTLDFASGVSADSGLLDLFSIQENQRLTPLPSGASLSTPLLAGVMNINTRHPEVLKAQLVGALKNDLDTASTSALTSADAQAIANAIVAETAVNSPLINRSEITNRLMNLPAVKAVLAGTVSKPEREAVTRALAESADTRTWNLLVDLVVQAGRYSPRAIEAGTPAALAQFDVQGERRYWLHLAIDRYTGKVIDQQLEVIHAE